ncbi:MAG: CBS domain-containing protein, partial [Clostridia bacterium]|nr:CBS domain-containing protein [Clostridia bacterium]
SHLPVVTIVDRQNRLQGVINPEELLRHEGTGIAADLVRPVESIIEDDATLNDALSTMLNYGERYVVVVNKRQEVQGIITFGYLLELMKEDAA